LFSTEILIFILWASYLKVVAVLHLQDQLSSYPDIAAYHCIAVTLGQAGLVKELFDVIDCMRSPPRKKFMVDPVQNWDPRLEPDLIVYHAVSVFVVSVIFEWNQCTMNPAC
jgi:hypothetical protein